MVLNGNIALPSQKATLNVLTYFTDKISNIRITLQAGLGYDNLVMSSVDIAFEGVPLKGLRTVDTATTESIINKSVNKFYSIKLCWKYI